MQEAVSSILLGRSREADGLTRMIGVSLGVHVVLMVAVALMPPGWLQTPVEENVPPMMISLGPSGTADTGGMTAITTAPVQRTEDAKPTPTPPAAKTPEMAAPAPEAKPLPKPVDKPLDKST